MEKYLNKTVWGMYGMQSISQKHKVTEYILVYVFECMCPLAFFVNMKPSNATQLCVGQVPHLHSTLLQRQASSAVNIATKKSVKRDEFCFQLSRCSQEQQVFLEGIMQVHSLLFSSKVIILSVKGRTGLTPTLEVALKKLLSLPNR